MSQGPHLVAAIFCDHILEEKENVLSAIRIVDRVTFSIVPDEDAAAAIGPMPLTSRIGPNLLVFNLLIMLKSGDFKGRGKVRTVTFAPSGKRMGEAIAEVELLGGSTGANVIFRGAFAPKESGVHWFDLYFDDRLLTRTPIEILLESSAQLTKSEDEQPHQLEKK